MQRKTTLGKETVYIDHDRSRRERNIQKEIVKLAKKEREKRKEVKIKFMRTKIAKNGIDKTTRQENWKKRGRFLKIN